MNNASDRLHSAVELANILGVTQRSIRKRSAKENWPYNKRPGRGGGKLFKLADLPEDVRAAIAVYEAKQLPIPVSPHQTTKPIPESTRQTGLARLELHTAWRK